MLSQQELSDRFEIQDLIYRYAQLVDGREIDALRTVFTEDAYIDYSAMGGAVGNLEDTLTFLKASLTADLFPSTQHLNANLQINVDGDTGIGRVMCFNPMEMNVPDSGTHVFMLGLWYVDKYVRTEKGWRIKERIEEKSWAFNLPDFMEF